MSNIFRDATEGTNAKRQDLLRRRRDEFVTMPHALRRVFVARRARISASIAVCVTGAALLATALSPSLTSVIASGMPGLNPAVLSTMVIAMWVTGIVAYTLSRAMGEHQFMVQMSSYVMPSDNLDHDVERLAHEHPDEIARGMAHRLEVRSAALPVIAAGVLLPVTALYVWKGIVAGGWPVIADFEANLAAHPGSLAASAVAGIVSGILMTKRAARVPVIAPIALAIALAAGVAAIVVTPWIGVGSLLAGTFAFIVWRLRKERDLLDTDDPAAGSEVFTFRGFIREVRGQLVRARNVVRRATVKQLAVLAGLAFATAGVIAYTTTSNDSPTAAAAPHLMGKPTFHPQVLAPSGSKSRIEALGDGRLRIEINLADDQPLDVALPGLVNVPHSWTARVPMFLEDQAGSIRVTAFPGDLTVAEQELGPTQREATFSLSACDALGHPFGMRVQSSTPGRYVFLITPVLEPAGC